MLLPPPNSYQHSDKSTCIYILSRKEHVKLHSVELLSCKSFKPCYLNIPPFRVPSLQGTSWLQPQVFKFYFMREREREREREFLLHCSGNAYKCHIGIVFEIYVLFVVNILLILRNENACFNNSFFHFIISKRKCLEI